MEPIFNRRRLFVAACGGMFMFGIALVLLGTLFGLPDMKIRMELTNLVRQGNLQSLMLLGVLISTVVSGPLIDSYGNKVVLTTSSVLVALALMRLSFAHTFLAACFGSLLLGLGGGGLNMATNALVSEIYREERGTKLNQLAVFFAVGALFIPLLAASALARLSMQQLMLLAAGLALALAVLYAGSIFPPARESHGVSWSEPMKVIRHPGVLLFGFLLFFESGNESALTGWTSTWVANSGASARTAIYVLALFQAMMMLGRIAAARLLRWIGEEQMVMATVVASLTSMALLLAVHSTVMMAVAVSMAGLAFAAIYPTILAIAGNRYQDYAATVFSVLFTLGLSGAVVYPWSIGHLAQSWGVRAGIILPLVGAAMMYLLMLVIRTRARRTQLEAPPAD
jgi:fucose permease